MGLCVHAMDIGIGKKIVTGIDIGTSHIKVVIAEYSPKNPSAIPHILGTGAALSKGLRHGYIINKSDTGRSIRAALHQAEKVAGIKVKKAYLAVGGVGLDEVRSSGESITSRADQEVTSLDIAHAIEDAEEKVASKIQNRKILHVIPLRYRLDGAPVLGRPLGMKGNKLEAEVLFITSLEQHLEDLISTIEDSGISVVDAMASPLAASFVTLTKSQKVAGVMLANIGAETVSVAVFENNIPISLKVFPIGSTDITNDIALGLKVSLEEAEHLKRGTLSNSEHPQKKLDQIISARLSDIFDLIDAHLSKIGRNGLLPAGIILTGGGSGITTVEDMARATLKLPSKIGHIIAQNGNGTKFKDSSWAVSYGLTIWGMSADEDSFGVEVAKKTGSTVMSWIKRFLP